MTCRIRPLRLVATVLAGLTLFACGGEAATQTTEEQTTTLPTTPTTATTTPAITTAPTLLCEEPPPTEIALGSTNTSEIDDVARNRCFWVEVPDGLDSITFEVSGLTEDLSLTVGYGFLVTLQYKFGEIWQSFEEGNADEVVVIDAPEPGPYFVEVGASGFDEVSPFSLGIHTAPETTAPMTGAALPDPGSCAPPATEIDLGSPVPSEIVGTDQPPEPRRYYCLQVPDGLAGVTITLTGLTGDLDLFVRRSVPAQWVDRTRGGGEREVEIANPEPGPYYIDVASAYPGASSPFTLAVTSA